MADNTNGAGDPSASNADAAKPPTKAQLAAAAKAALKEELGVDLGCKREACTVDRREAYDIELPSNGGTARVVRCQECGRQITTLPDGTTR